MKKATFAALLLSALASGYGVTCHAATYDYTQAMGSLELEFDRDCEPQQWQHLLL